MIRISMLVSVISAAPCAILWTRPHQFVHAGQVAGANGITHLGMGLHHIGRDTAGIQQGVMNAGIAGHVLAHVVDADIHQLYRVERATAEMRRSGGMRGPPGEDEIGTGVGQRWRHRHFPRSWKDAR